ncbi:MinD/ParA family ATP-binding protein [Specibacter sp. RAF43]|uniref:MinD/ParA family ATP-binding protein n=1 Tax=Specibacter sp. RAF43 TaxID=3233057 RepID=UPI003F9BD9CC
MSKSTMPGTPAGPDAGLDAGTEIAPDAAAGPETAVDAGTEAVDAGVEAGVDTVRPGGPEPDSAVLDSEAAEPGTGDLATSDDVATKVTITSGPVPNAGEDPDALDLLTPSTDPAFTGAVQAIEPTAPAAIPESPAAALHNVPPAPAPQDLAPTAAPPAPVPQDPPPAAPPAPAPQDLAPHSGEHSAVRHSAGQAPEQTAFEQTAPEPAAAPASYMPSAPAQAPGAPAWEPSTAHSPGAPGGSPRRQREDGPEPAAALTSDRLLSKVAAPPVGGWRRWLYALTLGAVNVGDSDRVRLERAQENLIASRLGNQTRYVPVLSRKGGVGKTTVTTLLGMVLAETREDRVIAMDANPDRGTLSDRSPGRADYTARNLVKDRFTVTTFSQLSDYVSRDGSRLDVLASDTDPTVAQAFDDSDYRAVTDILGKYYSIVLTDSGTGMVHSVMKGTLEKADAVVLVSGGSVDEARLASETLSWLEAHGRHDLVANAIVVINMSGGTTQVDIGQIESHFKSRVSNVLRIPYDKHLAEGSRVDLDKLRPATRAAVKELAALVVTELQRG